jgi:hypothetical protein
MWRRQSPPPGDASPTLHKSGIMQPYQMPGLNEDILHLIPGRLSIDSRLSRHGTARPGHLTQNRAAKGGPDNKPCHDGEEVAPRVNAKARRYYSRRPSSSRKRFVIPGSSTAKPRRTLAVNLDRIGPSTLSLQCSRDQAGTTPRTTRTIMGNDRGPSGKLTRYPSRTCRSIAPRTSSESAIKGPVTLPGPPVNVAQ